MNGDATLSNEAIFSLRKTRNGSHFDDRINPVMRKVPLWSRFLVGFMSTQQQFENDKVGFGDFQQIIDVWQFLRHPRGWRNLAGLETFVQTFGLGKVLHGMTVKVRMSRWRFVPEKVEFYMTESTLLYICAKQWKTNNTANADTPDARGEKHISCDFGWSFSGYPSLDVSSLSSHLSKLVISLYCT